MIEAVQIGLEHDRSLLLAKESLIGSDAQFAGEKAQYRPKHFLRIPFGM